MPGKRVVPWLVLQLLVLAALPLRAQTPSRVQWSARAPAGPVRANALVQVTLVAAIDPGWHIYSLTQPSGGPIALRISVPHDQPFVLGGMVRGPKPHIERTDTFDFPVELHSGATEFSVPLKLNSPPQNGVVQGEITARYQSCSDTICLPPRSVSIPIRLTITREDRR
jgi:thiol:disulfide interchange protein DsbD